MLTPPTDGPVVITGMLEFDLPTSDLASPGDASPRFVLGPENSLAAAPLERLLRGDDLAHAARLFNPLVLVGPGGSGKSLLAQALVRRWQSTLGSAAVGYFTAADFGRELQAAAAEERLAAWRSTVRSLRLLVIEDLDRLRPAPAIQQELRSTLDAVLAAAGAIVVTAAREPIALSSLEAGLVDRLAAGLAVRLQRPGPDARRAIVRLMAAAKGISLTDAALEGLARREAATPAELMGRLARATFVAGSRPSAKRGGNDGDGMVDLPKDAGSHADAPTLKQIIAVTARYFAVSQAALTGSSRRSSLVLARNVVVHLARRLTGMSYAEIGRGLGGRDHTTAMHAERRVVDQLARDPTLQQAVDELDRLLR